MHKNNIKPWEHAHDFGQGAKRPGEVRTLIVIGITGIMMLVEVTAGLLFGSMALLADGLHMGSHAAALSINVFAYSFARRHANNPDFSFGTGKVNALGGFAGAVLLAVFALMMAAESAKRVLHPVTIAYNQAIVVAVMGLAVNGACMWILKHNAQDHGHHHDHNLRSAYLHVLADALTSVLAIAALLTAKYFGVVWVDPIMGIVGAALVTHWSVGLIRSSSDVLLDKQAPKRLRAEVVDAIERPCGDSVSDLHIWSIGPNIYAAVIAVVAADPKPAEYYNALLPRERGLVHATVEVHRRDE